LAAKIAKLLALKNMAHFFASKIKITTLILFNRKIIGKKS
jgi:hypothetical protein